MLEEKVPQGETMSFNDSMSGYKKLTNTKNFTTEQLFEKFKEIKVSFGEPSMGTMTGDPAIVWKIDHFVVYIKADSKNIQIGGVLGEKIGLNLLKEVGKSLMSGGINSMSNAESDRAVEELYGIMQQLLGGAEVAQSTVMMNDNPDKLYIKQKLLSITNKYDVCKEDGTSVYWVEGNITGLNYTVSKNDEEIFSFKKKLVSITPEYKIYKGSEEVGEFKKKIKLSKPEMNGSFNGENISILGDLTGFHYTISVNGTVIGKVDSEKMILGDVYAISILDSAKTDLVVICGILVDNSLRTSVK